MKVPALLLLAAAFPAAALADGPAHRCDVDWLTKAQATPLGGSISDPNRYLSTGTAAGQPPVIDLQNPSKLCDPTVWRSLAADPALRAEWAKGLASQIKILIDADARFQRVDALGRAVLDKAEDVVKAAETAGVIGPRQDAGGPAALKKDGLTGDPYLDDKGYSVVAAAETPAGAPVDPAALRAALLQLIDDAAPKAKPAKGKAAPVRYKSGPAVAAFRKALVALANEVRGSHAAFADGDREAAAKFLADGAIKKGDEAGAYPAAALSRYDYGLRNLVALRAEAVERSLDAAKARLKGQSVASALAAAKLDKRLPANQTSADMAAAVLRRLDGVKDYHDLNALYDRESAKPDSDWMKANGADVKAQLEAYRADARATGVVTDPATKGRALQYSIGGQKITDAGIAVADLDADQGYRETIADAIAKNIATSPLSAKAQAALAAFRGEGASGSVVTPPLTPAQQKAAAELPVAAPPVKPGVVVAAPPSPYDALLKATPAQGFFGRIFGRKGNVERYYSKISEAAAAEAHARAARRTGTESAANDAAEAEQARQEAARSQLAAAPSDPDDSPAVAAAKRAAALQAFDVKAKAAIAAAHDGVIAADKSYVPSDKAAADLKAKRDALNATVDAAYADGIGKAVDKLDAAYKTAGTKQRAEAERRSGYEGAFYKPERVDQYFSDNWKGAAQGPSVEKCKASLGFDVKDAGGRFKDPSPENVDKYCGVHDGLIALLVSFKGTNKTLPVPTAAAK